MTEFRIQLVPGAGPVPADRLETAVDDLAEALADAILIPDPEDRRAELRCVIERAAEAHSGMRQYRSGLAFQRSILPWLREIARLSDDAVRFISAGAWTLEEVEETIEALRRPRGNPGGSRSSGIDLAPLRYTVDEVLRPWWEQHGCGAFKRDDVGGSAAADFVAEVAAVLDDRYTEANAATAMRRARRSA